MTKQASETIEYKGKEYALYSYPLQQHLDKNNIKLGMVATCAWRGYVGKWKIDKDKLLLTDLGLCDQTLPSLFNSNGPLFASWFSGTLKIAVGEMVDFGFFGEEKYDYYLLIEIVKGYILQKKIHQHFDCDPIINFGKYNGLPLSKLLKGDINFVNDPYFNCRIYVSQLLEYFCERKFNATIQIPQFDQTCELIEEAGSFNYHDVKFMVTEEFVAIDRFSRRWGKNEGKAWNFSRFIEKILLQNFNSLTIARRKDYRLSDIADDIFLINPDYDYLEWAITEVESFCVPPHLIEVPCILYRLETFKTKRLNDAIFEYDPVTTKVSFDMKPETKKINLAKFEKKYNVAYHTENKIYVPDFNTNHAANRYKYLLD